MSTGECKDAAIGAGTVGRSAWIADWVVPISSPPIRNGAVITENGRIVAVTTESEVTSGSVVANNVIRYDDAILTPALVNVHSHLELTALRGFLEGLDFGSWLRVLTDARSRIFSNDDILTASLAGIREGMLCGIGTFGDATATGVPMRAMLQSGVRGVAYLEVFGPDPLQCEVSIEGLKEGVRRLREESTRLVSVGVSPHAPYTVSQKLFRSVAEFAMAAGLPVSVHVAESVAETEFVTRYAGHFADRLKARGVAAPLLHRSPVELLRATGLLMAKPLLVHAIQIDERDADVIAESGSPVAHCPVSNAKLGHGMAPLGLLQRRAVVAGLGSDSVASNNRMDILGEGRQAQLTAAVHPYSPFAVSARDALYMATLGGAAALGLASETGSLEVGKSADIAVFDARSAMFGAVFDPEVTLINTIAGSAGVRLLLVGGALRVQEGEVSGGRCSAQLRGEMDSIATKLRDWKAEILKQ